MFCAVLVGRFASSVRRRSFGQGGVVEAAALRRWRGQSLCLPTAKAYWDKLKAVGSGEDHSARSAAVELQTLTIPRWGSSPRG